MAYSDKVIDHFNNPRNMGSFKKDEEGVGTGMVGAPECGDVMKLQIKVQNDTIVDAKFKTFGCGSAIASSSLATEWLKDPLLRARRRCDQGRPRGLPEESRRSTDRRKVT
jgi:nitrogen fixation NifU-like protein